MTNSSNFKKNGGEAGFIQIVLVVISALVILRYIYDIDIVGFFTQGWFRGILDKVYEFGTKGWEKYSETLITVWNHIIGFLKNLLTKVK